MKRNILQFSIAALVLVLFSGCVHESSEGSSHVFTYQLWVPLSVFLGGIIATPAGWFLRQASNRFAWVLLIGGALAALGFAPSLFRDRASVDDTAFKVRTGIWGLTSVHEVRFADLKQVHITKEISRGRRGSRHTNHYFVCERSDGTSVKVPVNNNVARAAAPHILDAVSSRGIPITDET